MEADKLSWHSTLHSKGDRLGFGRSFGGNSLDRKYSPSGTCIDTMQPFDVIVSFPVGAAGHLIAVEVQLSQRGRYCPLKLQLGGYAGMAELSRALADGMTPAISYWSADDLLWMDGIGAENRDGCSKFARKACSNMVKFDSFAIEDIDSRHTELVQMQQSVPALHDEYSQGQTGSDADHPATFTRRPPACSQAGDQCGGLQWEGPQCCGFGSVCQVVNSSYSFCKLLFEQEEHGLLEQSYYSRNRMARAVTTESSTSFVVKVAMFAAALSLCAIAAGFRACMCMRCMHDESHRQPRTLRAYRHTLKASWHRSFSAAYAPIERL